MKMITYWLIAFCIAGGATTAIAKVHQFQLKNGIKLLVKEDHRAPVVVTQIWYKVGSSYEHDGITGISHALEHMMFKGTKKYAPGAFSRIISENGGRENAFTGLDYTAYFQTLDQSRVEISFALEADRMRNLTLSEAEFAKEIEVIKEERRLRTEDNPRAATIEAAMAVAYQTSPYRQPVIGWMHDLSTMHTAQLRRWYQDWYVPNNATLVVAGDVKPTQIYQMVKKHFSPIPRAQTVAVNMRKEVEQSGMKRIKVKRAARLPYLLMIYKVPSLRQVIQDKTVAKWESYALEVLAHILDGGDSARLSSRLIRGQEVAASAAVYYNMVARLDTTSLRISGTPAQGRSNTELELALRQEVIDLQTRLIDDSELQRIKTQIIASDIYEKDSVFYQAMILGLLETVGLSWKVADQYVKNINAITPEQVRSVAKKYLVDTRLTVAELQPLPLNHENDASNAGIPVH